MPKFYLEVMKELDLGKKTWEGNKTGQKTMRVSYSCIGQTHEENVDFRKDFFREVLPFLDEIFAIISERWIEHYRLLRYFQENF